MISKDDLLTALAVVDDMGLAVLARRDALGVSQRVAAERAGVSQKTIDRLEHGYGCHTETALAVLGWLIQTAWAETPQEKPTWGGVVTPVRQRLSAVQERSDAGRSAADIARELGMTVRTVRRYRARGRAA
jgi:hypothetical protein